MTAKSPLSRFPSLALLSDPVNTPQRYQHSHTAGHETEAPQDGWKDWGANPNLHMHHRPLHCAMKPLCDPEPHLHEELGCLPPPPGNLE